jgi:hypothetical protein
MPSLAKPSPPKSPAPASGPERWVTDAGARDVARLDIPSDAYRDRTFEVSCSFFVSHVGAGGATHALHILVNGVQDSLDYRFRRSVPMGQPLRLTATTSVSRPGASAWSSRPKKPERIAPIHEPP